MSEFVDSLAYWLADFYLAATILLAAALVAIRVSRQPVKRLAVAKAAILAMLVLAGLSALPGWSVVSLMSSEATPAPKPMMVVPAAPAEMQITLPPTRVAAEPGVVRPVETIVEAAPEVREPISWPEIVLAVYLVGSVAVVLWLVLGSIAARRLVRRAEAAPANLSELLQSSASSQVRRAELIVSNEIDVAVALGVWQPRVILPSAWAARRSPEELSAVLAHEIAHVENGDLTWLAASRLLLVALWAQPLYWWLRRQMRLDQETLADAAAAEVAGRQAYAEQLVAWARDVVARPRPLLPASVGLWEGASQLRRRVAMLLDERYTVLRNWSVLARSAVIATAGVAAIGLSLTTLRPRAISAESTQTSPATEDSNGSLTYSGTVVDKQSQQPVAGATVTVRLQTSNTHPWKTLAETRHTTAADGTYEFTIPPEQVADKHLYIEIDVTHPDYAPLEGFGYALSMIRKNEKLGGRPFFDQIPLEPAATIHGIVKTPNGRAAANVPVLAFSAADMNSFGDFSHSWVRGQTDTEGRFHLNATKGGKAILWLLPTDYSQETHVLGDRRGDLETFALEDGIRLAGQVINRTGQPIAGVWVNAELVDGPAKHPIDMPVTDFIERSALTDTNGEFELAPMPSGTYRVLAAERPGENPQHDRQPRPMTDVFRPQRVELKSGEAPAPLKIQAAETVTIEAQIYDSAGNKRGGHAVHFSGRVGSEVGEFYFADGQPDADGHIVLRVPKGLQDAKLDLSCNEHQVLKHRQVGRGSLQSEREINLGNLERDWRGLEIIYYTAPILIVRAHDEQGKSIPEFKPAVFYQDSVKPRDAGSRWLSGVSGEVAFERQADGRWRSEQLLPDEAFFVTVTADGYQPVTESLSLEEGVTKELKVTLHKAGNASNQPEAPRKEADAAAMSTEPTGESGPADRVVEADRYVLCKVTTDLQRSLLGDVSKPDTVASACLMVNLSAFADEQLDAESPALKALSTRLAKWAKDDSRGLRIRVYVPPKFGGEAAEQREFATSFSLRLEKLARSAGYERAPWSRVYAGDFDWNQFVQNAESLAKTVPATAEQAVGNDRLKIFAVQTFLSRLLVTADCVVNILPIIDQSNAQGFPGNFQKDVSRFLPQLKYDRREVMLLRVRCTDAAEKQLSQWVENRPVKAQYAIDNGFKSCNLGTSYVAESDAGPKTEEIAGRVVLPDGSPAAGVQVTAFSMSEAGNHAKPYGYQRTTTDPEGHFRLSLYSGGKEVFWILPRDFVQQTHVINDRRGDLGTFELKSGLFFHGRVVDDDSKPIRNIWVNAELVDGPAKQKIEMPVADNIELASLSDAQGAFHLGPLPAGIYRVGPDEMPADDFRNLDESQRTLPAAFLPRRIELTAASELEEIEIKPVDSVTIEVRFLDSSGNPTRGNGFFLIGTMPDGRRAAFQRRQTGQEKVNFVAPRGLERTIIDFPRSSMRVRRSPNEPWENDWSLDLGTLDRDWREIEAVRYRTPTLVVTAKDASGNAIADFKPAIFYHYRDEQEPRAGRWIDDVRGDVDFEPLASRGRGSEHLLPDEEFTLTVTAAGYETFEATRSVQEGQTERVEAVLQPNNTSNAEKRSTGSVPANATDTEHVVVGSGAATRFVAGNPPTPWDYEPNAVRLEIEDADGNPASGVEATLYRVVQATGEREQVGRVTADESGVIEFRDVVRADAAAEFRQKLEKGQFPGSVRDIFYAVVKRPGMGTVILPASDFTIASRGLERRVRMRPAAELTGRVTDQDGKPVAGARVAAGALGGTFPLEGANAVKTDAEGRYQLTDLVAFDRAAGARRMAEQMQWATAANPPQEKVYPPIYDPLEAATTNQLVVMHPDFAVTSAEGGNIPGETNVVMAPAAAIEGRVVEFGTGKPAAGVRVQANGRIAADESVGLYQQVGSPTPLFEMHSHGASTRTDADGKYRLANLPAGTYEVWAQHPSNEWRESDWVSTVDRGLDAVPGPRALQAPDLVVGPGGTIHGRLADAATGKPLAIDGKDANVRAMFQFLDGVNQQQSQMQVASIAEDGSFTLRTFPSRSRLFVEVRAGDDANGEPRSEYRVPDDFYEAGRVFDLKHGESINADVPVVSTRKLEKTRQLDQQGFEALQAREYSKAIRAFSDAIAISPYDLTALGGRAQAYDGSGQLAEAIADLERILKLDPNDLMWLNNLAHTLATSPNGADRDGSRAVALAKRAIALADRSKLPAASRAQLLDTLAAAAAEAGDFNAAVATQREAIEKAPTEQRNALREKLKLYETKRPYRRPTHSPDE